MFNKRAEIDNLKLKNHKLKLDVSDRDREISRLNSGIKEMSKHYSERCSKPYVSADMATNIKLDTAEMAKFINALSQALSAVPQHEDKQDKENQPKIHELSSQPLGVYENGKLIKCWLNTDDHKMVELLSKPNTRLAIIEDDEDA
jgi:hypothetical protein